ncbi:uncharacterized protein LOC120010135 isoform X2 [Tripterygium wilfordii]|uniref:uncharacterized protein LOC120010135 isoform X2 n=1 Tax=Tripterygium wilfordii TaxID=458696 RepID=UPI0018F85B14|nr:uncharacterized protein LOC120010135 isoform X2 [Tripterygium wilfordii]
MDTRGTPENAKKGFRIHFLLLRLALAFLFPIFVFVFLLVLIGFIAVLFVDLSVVSPTSVPSQCKIVSSSVDIRSSKVCEPELLNNGGKHVFYPFDRNKFGCRYDYYWASVFEVEYKHQSLGETQVARAEAPNEALPLDCRPSFGAAWLTKDKFKVNKTYDCWYTSGISKVSLYRDGFFNCRTKDLSSAEKMRWVRSTKILRSWVSNKKGRAVYWRWETIAGVITGFLTSLITISFVKVLSWLPRLARMIAGAVNRVCLKRACFLVAYFSFMGWLAVQYGKRLGFPEIYRIYNH